MERLLFAESRSMLSMIMFWLTLTLNPCFGQSASIDDAPELTAAGELMGTLRRLNVARDQQGIHKALENIDMAYSWSLEPVRTTNRRMEIVRYLESDEFLEEHRNVASDPDAAYFRIGKVRFWFDIQPILLSYHPYEAEVASDFVKLVIRRHERAETGQQMRTLFGIAISAHDVRSLAMMLANGDGVATDHTRARRLVRLYRLQRFDRFLYDSFGKPMRPPKLRYCRDFSQSQGDRDLCLQWSRDFGRQQSQLAAERFQGWLKTSPEEGRNLFLRLKQAYEIYESAERSFYQEAARRVSPLTEEGVDVAKMTRMHFRETLETLSGMHTLPESRQDLKRKKKELLRRLAQIDLIQNRAQLQSEQAHALMKALEAWAVYHQTWQYLAAFFPDAQRGQSRLLLEVMLLKQWLAVKESCQSISCSAR